MPSLSSKTDTKRRSRKNAMGKRRKRQLRKGTTPAFPIHPEGKPESAEGKPESAKKKSEK